MGGDEHVPRIMKSVRLRSALLRRLGQRFAPILNILRDALQTLAGGFRSRGYFFDIGEGVGIVGFLSKFFKERMDLGENEEHFSATTRLQKEVFFERAVQHDGPSHNTIAAYLATPGSFRH